MSTVTKISWAWATNTDVNFNPATDVLDFGWFQSGQFTISEVSGKVVISIPSNNQTYTLLNTTLQDLHLSNITAKDPSAISAWAAVLNDANSVTPTPPATTLPATTPPVVTPPSETPPVTTPGSADTWSASAVYTAGTTVVVGGVTYKANWWVQGVDPVQNSGAAGSGEAWTIIAGASNDPIPWSAAKVYTAGMQVIEGGVVYQANWWTKGNDPQFNHGVSGQPWSVVGPPDSPSAAAVPTVPDGLAATETSADSITLTWNASSVPDGAAVTGYAIFLNNQQIATTTGTTYTIANLTANTTYQFSVSAIDAAGSSAQASPIFVHTASATSGDPAAGDGSSAREFAPSASRRTRNWSTPPACRSTARRCGSKTRRSISRPEWPSPSRSGPGRGASSAIFSPRSSATRMRACASDEQLQLTRMRPGHRAARPVACIISADTATRAARAAR